jgi:hypothetical protein
LKQSVNEEFMVWLQKKYCKHGDVKVHWGPKFDYLGMVFNYTNKGILKVDISKYVEDMVDEFPVKLKLTNTTASTPVAEDLFAAGQSKKLNAARKEMFHT